MNNILEINKKEMNECSVGMCTFISSIQNGIKQHPQKHPKKQMIPAVNQTARPESSSTLVMIE